jgi:hypothetical protein
LAKSTDLRAALHAASAVERGCADRLAVWFGPLPEPRRQATRARPALMFSDEAISMSKATDDATAVSKTDEAASRGKGVMDEFQYDLFGSEPHTADITSTQQGGQGDRDDQKQAHAPTPSAPKPKRRDRKPDERRIAAHRARLEREAEEIGCKLISFNEEAANEEAGGVSEYAVDDDLEFHDLCRLFPLVEGDEFDVLVEDIRQHDQHGPGTLHQGKILDGRNRYRADKIAGRPFRARQLPPGTDPVAFIISANIRRRHLSTEQKQDLIAQLLKDDPTRSDRAIARNVGVDKNTVATVRAKQESRGEIHHVETRVDSKGRRQPAIKPKIDLVRADLERRRDPEEPGPGDNGRVRQSRCRPPITCASYQTIQS